MSDRNQGFATTLVPVDKIKPPLFQCRIQSLDENLDELVESIKTVGLLEPLVIRIGSEKQPELVIGSRRLKACEKAGLTMIPVVVRDLTDEEALEIEGSENLNRNDLSAEEKTRLVSEWAKRGYDANGIVQKVHKSYSWVVSFLPSQFKDQMKAEAGKLGGEAKAATISVAETAAISERKQTVKIQDTVQCDRCHVSTGTPVEWHNHRLCQTCHGKALADPDGFNGYFIAVSKKPEPHVVLTTDTPRSLDSWGYRKSQMSPQHSKMEGIVIASLIESGVTGIVQDRRFCIQETVPDIYIPAQNIAIYLDGQVHDGKEDQDEKLRELLKKRHGVNYFSYSYDSPSQKEVDRVTKEILSVVKVEA